MHCDFGGHSLNDCYREAQRQCPQGYVELETPADVAWSRRGEMMFDRFYVGKPPKRVVSIECAAPTTASGSATPPATTTAPSGAAAPGGAATPAGAAPATSANVAPPSAEPAPPAIYPLPPAAAAPPTGTTPPAAPR